MLVGSMKSVNGPPPMLTMIGFRTEKPAISEIVPSDTYLAYPIVAELVKTKKYSVLGSNCAIAENDSIPSGLLGPVRIAISVSGPLPLLL